MENVQLVKCDNREGLGIHYFQKGLRFALNREISKAFEFFKECLDFVTCDCDFRSWDVEDEYDFAPLEDINNANSNHAEFYFVKAFLITYAKSYKNPHIALDAIHNYLLSTRDFYGYYLQGKILCQLERYHESLISFNNAESICSNSLILFQIGLIKEKYLQSYGLDNMVSALILNPSSRCCATQIKVCYNKSDFILIKHDVENDLVDFFIDKTFPSIRFEVKYYRVLESLESHENRNKIDIFKEFLELNKIPFLIEDKEYEDDTYDDYAYDYVDMCTPSDDDYYNDALDMDQQSPEFWDNI